MGTLPWWRPFWHATGARGYQRFGDGSILTEVSRDPQTLRPIESTAQPTSTGVARTAQPPSSTARSQTPTYEGRPLANPDEDIYDQGLALHIQNMLDPRRGLQLVGFR